MAIQASLKKSIMIIMGTVFCVDKSVCSFSIKPQDVQRGLCVTDLTLSVAPESTID